MNTEESRQIAQNPNTSGEVLRKLANNRDMLTRMNVAANPNIPTDVLWKLGQEFPKKIIGHPIFSLLLIEKPNLLEEIPFKTLKSMLKEDSVPIYFLNLALNQGDSKINDMLLAIARSLQTSKELLEKIFHSNARLDLRIVLAIARNLQTPQEILEKIFHSEDRLTFRILSAIARNPNTPKELLDKLLERDDRLDTKIVLAIARNPQTPQEILNKLPDNYDGLDSNILSEIARNPHTPQELLEKIFHSEDRLTFRILSAIARNPKTPKELLDKLLERDGRLDTEIVLAIARNPHTPQEILNKLPNNYDRLDSNILSEIASNPHTPQEILEKIFHSDDRLNPEIVLAIARNPHTPQELTEELQQIAQNPHTSPELLRKLANSSDILIRKNVAINPNISTDILWKLGQEFPREILNNSIFFLLLIEKPNLLEEIPSKTLKSILNDDSVPIFFLNWTLNQGDARINDMLLAIARNPQTPKKLLEKIFHSNARLDLRIVLAIARNPHIPKELTEELQQIAQNPHTSPELLRELAHSIDKLTRKNVAANPNILIDVLWELGEEFPQEILNNPIFSLLLLEKPNLVEEIPPTTLITLLKEENVPMSFLAWAANQNNMEILLSIVMNPRTSKEILDKLLVSQYIQNTNIAQTVRLHVNLPEEINENYDEAIIAGIQTADILKKNQDQYSNNYLKESSWINSIPDIIFDCLPKNNYYDRVREALALRERVSYDSRIPWSIRNLLAQSQETLDNLLEKLAKDKDKNIRYLVARTPDTPVNLLRQLALDEDDNVRYAVALNSNTEELMLKELTKDKNEQIRRTATYRLPIAVAQNHHTYMNDLWDLFQNTKDGETRLLSIKKYLVKKIDDLPLVLKNYAKNLPPSQERFCILMHPKIPGSVLAQHYRSTLWIERYAIAQHHNTPTEILYTLAKDGNRIVRAAAKANLQTLSEFNLL